MPTLIQSTSRATLDAIRYQGILVTESYTQIRSTLEKSLSPAHALFFAEPVHAATGASVDWYTDAPGSLVPLASLNPEAQALAFQQISTLAAEILALADELVLSQDPSKNIRGNILRLALKYPGTDYLHMAGNQPVVTGWGFRPANSAATPEDLIRLGTLLPVVQPIPAAAAETTPEAAPEVAVPTTVVTIRRSSGFLNALLGLFLGILLLVGLFFLLGLLFGPQGLVIPDLRMGGCSVPTVSFNGTAPAPGVIPDAKQKTSRIPTVYGCSAERPQDIQFSPEALKEMKLHQEREAELRKQIEDARLALMQRVAQCPRNTPVVPETPPSPPPVEVPLPEEAPDLAELLPSTPEIAPPPPPPVEQPAEQPPIPPKKETPPPPKPKKETPPPPPPKPKKGEELSIPEDAKKNNDFSFLEGCWESETDLFNDVTGAPLVSEYCFDGKGAGKRINTEPKDRCVGPVHAKFDNAGRLSLNSASAPCTSGTYYVPHKVICTQKGDKAQCFGQELGSKRNKWQARFRRK